jgi:hypothetical protein
MPHAFETFAAKVARILCLALVVLLLPSASSADTIMLVSSRDSTLFQEAPGNSDGAGRSMFVGTTAHGPSRRALIGFDIAGNIPAGAIVTGVQLRVVMEGKAQNESMMRPIELRRLLADWGEGTTGKGTGGLGTGRGFATPANGTAATWSHGFYNTVPWINAGGDFAGAASGITMVGLTANMPAVWDSTPAMVNDVQSWLDSPASNFGWLLLGDESTAHTARLLFTREAANMASRPTVVIAFTPPNLAATRLAVSAPASITAGSPFDVTVAALDNNGNVAPAYTGTVTFSSTDPHPGVLPADYTFTAGDQGKHTFSAVTLFTAGSQTLSAQDTADSSITSSASIAVAAAPADHLLITAPQSAVSGAPFDVIVTALDPYGNVDANYSGTVTWASSDSDRGVMLPADYPFQAADSGTHAFPSGVTLVTLGDQSLTAADTGSGITGLATVTVGPSP